MKKILSLLKTTATLLVGYGIVTLIRNRARKPNRLFFYGAISDLHKVAPVANVAVIGPDFFQFQNPFRDFPFLSWTFVTSAANGKNKWLYFHNVEDGATGIGFIDGDYNFILKKFYPKSSNTQANTRWSYIAVDGRGYLLLVDPSSQQEPGKITIGFAQVLGDGSYVEWWRTQLSMPYPHVVVGLPNAHAWYARDPSPGKGGTLYVFDVKHAQVLSTRRWENVQWSGIVSEKSVLFLYNFESRAELCGFDKNNQLVTIDSFWAHDIKFDTVASTPGAHLCWQYQSGGHAVIRVLDANGFKVSKDVSLGDGIKDQWHFIVPC